MNGAQMDDAVYEEMNRLEENYWWFVARRKIIETVIRKTVSNSDLKILEIGCGTGGNLPMLSKFGSGKAIEMNISALNLAQRKDQQNFHLHQGSVPFESGLQKDDRFELVCIFDVLEHITEDTETLLFIKNHMQDSGSILITVPAYQWLWSNHDVMNHHKRRYTKRELLTLLQIAGYEIVFASYFNSILFPVALIKRLGMKTKINRTTTELPEVSGMLNVLLRSVFSMEATIINFFKLPAGLSIIVAAKKKL
jgi:2-polyprenyl-3-methyl-5-hydroxy-6-metoxy-1,4-benzoquinol methylase